MKFSRERPPNMKRLEEVFGVTWGGDLVVTYGDTVHHSKELDRSVIVHELVHVTRQKNPDEWWENYIRDSKFRLGEELLAYRAQYQYLKETTKNRDLLMRHLLRLANDLSNMYKLPVTQAEAVRLIKAR